jgi:hypothetical protein
MPSSPRTRTLACVDHGPAEVGGDGLGPLFAAIASTLLEAPLASPPPQKPTVRRKTLAIHRSGFPLRRSSTRIREQCKAKPIIQEAEAFVCKNLGIVKDGEVVTEHALNVFVQMFKGQVSSKVVHALRTMFKLDDTASIDVEQAMMLRGGAAALEQFDPI